MDQHPILKPQPTLADIQQYVDETNVYRGHNVDLQYCVMLLCEEVGEVAKAVRKTIGGKMDPNSKDTHVDEEAADVLWVLTAICNGLGIDLEQALRDKEAKNKLRVWK